MRQLFCIVGIAGTLWAADIAPKRHRLLLSRLGPARTALFIANADGSMERPLIPADGLDYDASFSSDGRWIVFTSERGGSADIYRVHPDGAALERITNDPAYDDQAALSPDGKTLAFVSSRGTGKADIWLLDLASSRYRNLTNRAANFRPSWSPDGKWIAFTSDRDSNAGDLAGRWEHLQSTGLYVVHPDGSDLRRLTPAGGFAGSPKWSKDGRRIVYYETDENGSWMLRRTVDNAHSRIASIDVETGAKTVHLDSGNVKLSPEWLADGRIGYVAKGVGNEGLELLSPDGAVTHGARGAIRNPSWSSDGKLVVYQRVFEASRAHRMDTTFSRDPEFELVLTEPFPAFSPQGDRLAYTGTLDGRDVMNTSIDIMNGDGSARRRLFWREGFSAFSAAWSPGGDQIAFSVGRYFRAAGHPAAQVALIRPDGSGFLVIADDGMNNGFPSWSPDGKRIVYKKERQLVILSLDDGRLTTLTSGPHYDNFPQWSPKGDRIAFTSNRDGNFEIYTIKPDGSDLRRLTDARGNDGHCIWSPDGEWIVFSSSRMGFKDEAPLSENIPQPYGELFVMRANGAGLRQLTDNQWEDATPAWRP